MKPTIKEFQEAQKLFYENKKEWEEEGKITGKGGRDDGYVAEDLVRRTLDWTQNNQYDVQEPDVYEETLGYGDIKTGSAKKYGGTFWLEVIQNPRTKSIAGWTKGSTDFIAYLDWSDDTYPVYLFSVKKLVKKLHITEICKHITDVHFKMYDERWSKNSRLPVPRLADTGEYSMSFSCFGKRALGFELPIEWASGKLTLTDYLEAQDDRTTTSTAGTNRTNKEKSNSNLRNSKR